MFVVLTAVVVVTGFRWALVPSILRGLAYNALLGLLLLQLLPPRASDLTLGGGFWGLAHSNLADLFVPGSGVAFGPNVMPGTGIHWKGVLGAWAGLQTDIGPDPDSYYLGGGMLGLVMVALWRGGRLAWGLFLGGALLALLSTGTSMEWGSYVLAQGEATPWGWLMAHVPVLQAYDLPRCFMLGASMAVVATGSLGLAMLRWRPWPIALLAGAIFLVDYARLGIPLTTALTEVPSIYRDLASFPDDRTVLELPTGIVESKGGLGYGQENSRAMYWQTIHRHPRVGCYISRVPKSTFSWFAHAPVISDLLLMTGNNHSFGGYWNEARTVTRLGDHPPEIVDQFVRDFRLGYIVFLAHEQQAFYRSEVDRLFGDRIVERRAADGLSLYVLR
jgi:hypothetical protein